MSPAPHRPPERGWWTPEFRAWSEAYERHECPYELDELDAAACAAGDRLTSSDRRVDRLAAIALSIALSLDDGNTRAARALAVELTDLVDELRHERQDRPVAVIG